MKKLLLIGAMLVVGATSFSEVLVKLTEDNQGQKIKYTGQGTMEVTSKGSIIDPTNRLVLVVEPSVSTGADHTALAFDFDKLFKGETRIRESEFIAQVLNDKTPVPILNTNGTSAISADLDDATKDQVLPLMNDNRDKIGAISYAMSGGSGLTNNNTVYKGRVLAQIAIGRDETGNNIESVKTGSFTHSSSSVKVTLTNLKVNKN
jgi:hypothetical protein